MTQLQIPNVYNGQGHDIAVADMVLIQTKPVTVSHEPSIRVSKETAAWKEGFTLNEYTDVSSILC